MSQEVTVYSTPRRGNPLRLSDLVAEGGEGVVYKVVPPGEKKEIAVKIYNAKKLSESRDVLNRKIAAMVKIGERSKKSLIRQPMIAWPQKPAYDEQGRFVGYGMKLAEGKTLTRLAHLKLYEKHFPDMDREKVAQMLIRVWGATEILHNNDIYIGDVNLNNVLCDERYVPCWIDSDSFQVGDPQKGGFCCPVGRPEMTPPEHQDTPYDKIVRTRESDYFSMAILTFQCLMLGKHPYAHIGSGNPVDNLRKGHVPYLTGGSAPGRDGAVPPGPWYNIWDWYTHEVKKCVQLALKDGAENSSVRPSPKYWIEALRAYVHVLNHPRSEHPREMVPSQPKPRGKDPRDTRNVFSVNKGETP